MDDNPADFDQTDEDVLTNEVSDEALEAASTAWAITLFELFACCVQSR